MESTSLIIGIVIIIGLFFLLRWLIPSKGKVGEKVVAGKLDHLPKDQYRVLNNVTIPTPKGSSQIDHLVVSIYCLLLRAKTAKSVPIRPKPRYTGRDGISAVEVAKIWTDRKRGRR